MENRNFVLKLLNDPTVISVHLMCFSPHYCTVVCEYDNGSKEDKLISKGVYDSFDGSEIRGNRNLNETWRKKILK